MTDRDGEVPGVHVWLVLHRAHEAVAGAARRSIEDLDMCYSDFAILEVLLHEGPLPVTTIAEKILLTSGSLTTAVDRLEERDLVERRPDPTDRRVRMVHLTDRGREVIEAAFEDHRARMEELASVLEPDERADLVGHLKTLGHEAADRLEASD